MSESDQFKTLITNLLSAKAYNEVTSVLEQAELLNANRKKIIALGLYVIDEKRIYEQEGYNSFSTFVEDRLEIFGSDASYYKRIGAVIAECFRDSRSSLVKWDWYDLKPFLEDKHFQVGKLYFLPEAFENHPHEPEALWRALEELSEPEFRKFAHSNPLLPGEKALPKTLDSETYKVFSDVLKENKAHSELMEKVYRLDEHTNEFTLSADTATKDDKASLFETLHKCRIPYLATQADIPRKISSQAMYNIARHCEQPQKTILQDAYEYIPEEDSYYRNILVTPKIATTISEVLIRSGVKKNNLKSFSEDFSTNSAGSIRNKPLFKNYTSFPLIDSKENPLQQLFIPKS